MDELMARISTLGIAPRSNEDMLEQLLMKMSIGENTPDVKTLLDRFDKFDELLINSPYVVQANPNKLNSGILNQGLPRFVNGVNFNYTGGSLYLNGMDFNYASVPRKKIGWSILAKLCGRTFFRPIKGNTLYDRLRKYYYVNIDNGVKKTLIKVNGQYFIYNDLTKDLTPVRLPHEYMDYVSPLDTTYSAFNNITDINGAENILLAYTDQLLEGMEPTEANRQILHEVINSVLGINNRKTAPQIANVQGGRKRRGILPDLMEGVQEITERAQEELPQIRDTVMRKVRNIREEYVIPAKRLRNLFGKKKRNTKNFTLKEIRKMIKQVLKY